MNFIIARDIKYDTFIMCNDKGTNTVTIDKEQLINMKQKEINGLQSICIRYT